MIKDGQKFDETQLAEFIHNDILSSLERLGKSINNQFKYDRVVLIDALKENFSFDNLFQILSEKREGIYRVQKSDIGYHFMCDFKRI